MFNCVFVTVVIVIATAWMVTVRQSVGYWLSIFFPGRVIHEPVVVLVGTERHLHAVEMADETANAEKALGLDNVAALLFLAGAELAVHVTADVTVTVGTSGVIVIIVVVAVSLYVR